MNGRVARDDGGKKGGKKGSKGSKLDGYGDKDKGGNGSEGKCTKPDTAVTVASKVNCPYKWANSIDEEDDRTSSWESEPVKNSRAWRRLTKKVSGAGLRRAESAGGEGGLTRDLQLTISQRKTKTNRCRGD